MRSDSVATSRATFECMNQKGTRSMLEGKVIIITGAGSGMGRATAKLCAERGASVVAVDLKEDAVASVVAEITASGGSALAHAADLTVESAVAGVIDATVERFGTVHALHNNAYAVHPGAGTDLVNKIGRAHV